MKIKKSYTEAEILDAGLCGLEFEFYSNLEVLETARSLSKYLDKRVVVPMALSKLNDEKPLYHSPIKPSSDIFKLEPDYSGGKNMCELVTGPMPYKDARNIIIKVFEWIKSNGYTTKKCSIHVNLSIDGVKLPTIKSIPKIDITKFILDFDESLIYDVFPDRKDSVYARSIKLVKPNNVMFYTPSLEEFSRSTLTLPVSEKYFGVNFLKAEKGYLEYRYIGGADYHLKTRKILDLVNYFILHLHKTLNFNGEYSQTDRLKFKKMMENQEKLYKSFVRYEDFKKNYPEFEVTVDTSSDEQLMKSMWSNIREKLFTVLSCGKITKGFFNYDTEVGKYQLKDTTVNNLYIQDVEFINCKLQGVISNSWFYNCEIKDSRIANCDAVQENTFYSSKIENTVLHVGNTCKDCYIENKRNIINCEMIGGVIRNGEVGKLAKISKETMRVEAIEPNESPGSFKEINHKNKKEKTGK